MNFAVRRTTLPDRLVLHVAGEVDTATAPELAAAGAAALDDCPTVVLDLAGCTFLDAAGLGALVANRRYALDRGASFRLTAVPDRVRSLLTIAGLADTLLAETLLAETLLAGAPLAGTPLPG